MRDKAIRDLRFVFRAIAIVARQKLAFDHQTVQSETASRLDLVGL